MSVCGHCLRTPPPHGRAVAAFDYAFPWDRLISAFKFGNDPSLARDLSTPLVDTLQAWHGEETRQIGWVLPMPLSAQRLHERGYNQAWEVARIVATALGRPARADLLLRWRDTAHQVTLARDDRAANVRGAFMTAPGARALLAGRHVALVDDVMTSGASVAEASRVLLEAGVASVTLWLLARTPDS